MKKILISINLLMMICIGLNAQKGNIGMSINGDVSIPVNQNDQGLGIFVKGLYGIGKSAQITVSAGVSRFTNSNSVEEVNTRLIPILVGYKQNICHFFIEPQLGLGELGGRIKLEGDYARPSVAAIYGAIGAGYTFKRFNAGMRFQTAHGIEGSSAGTWHDKNFHYAAISIGYTIF